MPADESVARNFVVTGVVALVCSLAVSVTSVGLRERREGHRDEKRMRAVLEAAGVLDPDVPVEIAARRVETRTLDLRTGQYVDPGEVDRTQTVALPPGEDPADLEKRERYVDVHLVREAGRVTCIVLPVRGMGWSMMHGFVGLDRDLATIRGFVVHRHEETPGLGAEVENPRWKQKWVGKRLFDREGRYRFELRPASAEAKPGEEPYTVDGLTGASVTTGGVERLLRFWFGERGYAPYLRRLEERGVDHG